MQKFRPFMTGTSLCLTVTPANPNSLFTQREISCLSICNSEKSVRYMRAKIRPWIQFLLV